MTTPTTTPESFLAALRRELADLPADDVAELLEDVEQHLAEASADGRLDELGTPSAYAAELRAAAGLPLRGEDGTPEPVRRWLTRIQATRAYREVRAFAPELRPAGWVARGYLVVLALAWWTHDSLREVVPIPHVSGNALLGLLATGGAIVASVAWGRRDPSHGRVARIAIGVTHALLVVIAFNVATDIEDRAGTAVWFTSYPQQLNGPFGPISDLYVRGPDGELMRDVTIYDEQGNLVAPMICDRYCRKLTFPLYEPAPTPTPTPKATPTPTPTPKATRTPKVTPSKR